MDDNAILGLELIAAPQAEPIEAADVLESGRDPNTDEAGLLGGFIVAARELCEEATGRSFCTQTWRLNLDCFPSAEGGLIQLFRGPWPSGAIVELAYTDTDGDAAELDSDDYQFDHVRGRLLPARGTTWPATRSDTVNAVRITYTAGYGDPDDVPGRVKEAIKATCLDWLASDRRIRFSLPSGITELLMTVWDGR